MVGPLLHVYVMIISKNSNGTTSESSTSDIIRPIPSIESFWRHRFKKAPWWLQEASSLAEAWKFGPLWIGVQLSNFEAPGKKAMEENNDN